MSKASKLIALKIAHTIIWVFYACLLINMYYLVFSNEINSTFWVSVSLVLLEAIILLICGWKCPITVYMESLADNFIVGSDIFLPKWMAVYNKFGYTTLFVLCLVIAIYKLYL